MEGRRGEEHTRRASFAWGMASHGAGRSRKTGQGDEEEGRELGKVIYLNRRCFGR